MSSSRKACIKAVITTLVFATVALTGTSAVDADTSAKTTNGVVLKTSQLKVNKVIVSPPAAAEKGRLASNDGSKDQLSRGSNGASNDIINYAYNFIGTPYVFGSNGPSAFDCSAFTKYVFSHFGIGLPRTSQAQYNAGTNISRNNLQPGDLVFFNTYTYLGHVGIYIGGGDFIHASSSKGVTVSSLNDGYYNSRFQGGTRVR